MTAAIHVPRPAPNIGPMRVQRLGKKIVADLALKPEVTLAQSAATKPLPHEQRARASMRRAMPSRAELHQLVLAQPRVRKAAAMVSAARVPTKH